MPALATLLIQPFMNDNSRRTVLTQLPEFQGTAAGTEFHHLLGARFARQEEHKAPVIRARACECLSASEEAS